MGAWPIRPSRCIRQRQCLSRHFVTDRLNLGNRLNWSNFSMLLENWLWDANGILYDISLSSCAVNFPLHPELYKLRMLKNHNLVVVLAVFKGIELFRGKNNETSLTTTVSNFALWCCLLGAARVSFLAAHPLGTMTNWSKVTDLVLFLRFPVSKSPILSWRLPSLGFSFSDYPFFKARNFSSF